jgi:hypothetical protein
MSHPHTSTQETPDRTFVLGQALRATILATAEETDGHLDLMDGVQPPDAATPLHMHTRYEERYWVISGTMTVYAGSDKRPSARATTTSSRRTFPTWSGSVPRAPVPSSSAHRRGSPSS